MTLSPGVNWTMGGVMYCRNPINLANQLLNMNTDHNPLLYAQLPCIFNVSFPDAILVPLEYTWQ